MKIKSGSHVIASEAVAALAQESPSQTRRAGELALRRHLEISGATAQYEKRKTKTSGILRKIASHIQTIVGAEKEDFDDSLRVEVIIKTDERSRKHLTLGEKRIEDMAKDVVKNFEQDDDFTIVTNSGQKIKANEIFLTEVVLIDGHGKSVKLQRAWDALSDFYKSIKKAGALET